MGMRALICALFGHVVYLEPDDLWSGREADCHRCGFVVKFLTSFGWVRK